MNISIITEEKPFGKMMEARQIHLILPASESLGFGMTRAYLRFNCKMDDYTIERFISLVKEKNEVGSLYPRFNLSVFPVKREYFEQYINEILDIEIMYVKSKHLVFDFFANSFDKEDLNIFIEELKRVTVNEKNFDGQIEIRSHIIRNE